MNRQQRRQAIRNGMSYKEAIDTTLRDERTRAFKDGMQYLIEVTFYMTAYSIQLEFGLGKKRLQRAMRRVYDNIDAFRSGHLEPQDYETIKKEIQDMGVSINIGG